MFPRSFEEFWFSLQFNISSIHVAVNNTFTGSLPSEFGLMNKLNYLGLCKYFSTQWFNFCHAVSCFWYLSKCFILRINVAVKNRLTGSLPSEIGLMNKLTYLTSCKCQYFVWFQFLSTSFNAFKFSSQLSFILTMIIADKNELTGSLPSEIGLITALNNLGLCKCYYLEWVHLLSTSLILVLTSYFSFLMLILQMIMSWLETFQARLDSWPN